MILEVLQCCGQCVIESFFPKICDGDSVADTTALESTVLLDDETIITHC